MTNPLEQIREELRDKIAKAIADVIGHGLREKCELHADAVMKILSASQGYVCVPVEQADDLIEREDGRASAYQIAEAALRLVGKRDSVDNRTLLSVVDRYMPSRLAASKETNRE